ncbi:hypothetical protein ACD591_00035 [Rufibacter glacialis]|uniref:Uncharacterized protein n=1 Tax=Rufibacter glacialis TaxID=1259555 RepID=A0A5M8QKW3_9BACT|nr:hypothetical protein [Rufibacter glacialis]KAA6435303.1 hypothetical protein FOE74_04950 [Rufibacter glacialis]GGK62168.1 hypothetical protein GCM10011405_07860 [Rufibacter glacialis]
MAEGFNLGSLVSNYLIKRKKGLKAKKELREKARKGGLSPKEKARVRGSGSGGSRGKPSPVGNISLILAFSLGEKERRGSVSGLVCRRGFYIICIVRLLLPVC